MVAGIWREFFIPRGNGANLEQYSEVLVVDGEEILDG